MDLWVNNSRKWRIQFKIHFNHEQIPINSNKLQQITINYAKMIKMIYTLRIKIIWLFLSLPQVWCKQAHDSLFFERQFSILNNMIQSFRLSRAVICEKHHNPITHICTAPECFNYREICQSCREEDSLHRKMHFDRSQAYMKVHENMENIFKGLRTLRGKIIQKMDTSMNNHEVLKQIANKLQQIKSMLNSKIDKFRVELYNLYQMNIKQKLKELFLIVEKSNQFLQQERLKLIRTQKIKPFFINDIGHDLKYYQSYYEQILQKNVQKFKTGLQHDKVMKLLMSFSQNLSQIFKFEQPVTIIEKPHLFYSDSQSQYIIKLPPTSGLMRQQLLFVPDKDIWIGIVPSVYYSLNENHYLFGQGKRQSNRISRISLKDKEFKTLEIKMETKRFNFSVCLLKNQIYIVGGQNSKEGCLVKCQKFIPSQGKTYIMNSLNQRSSQHSICTFKDKFILKFGGSNMMQTILQGQYEERYSPLFPEIYSLETEDWRVIELTNQTYSPINFGLWPALFDVSSRDKVIVLQGESQRSKFFRGRYDIMIELIEKQIKQVKVESASIPPSQYDEFRYISWCNQENQDKIRFVAQYKNSKFSAVNINI